MLHSCRLRQTEINSHYFTDLCYHLNFYHDIFEHASFIYSSHNCRAVLLIVLFRTVFKTCFFANQHVLGNNNSQVIKFPSINVGSAPQKLNDMSRKLFFCTWKCGPFPINQFNQKAWISQQMIYDLPVCQEPTVCSAPYSLSYPGHTKQLANQVSRLAVSYIVRVFPVNIMSLLFCDCLNCFGSLYSDL